MLLVVVLEMTGTEELSSLLREAPVKTSAATSKPPFLEIPINKSINKIIIGFDIR